MKKMALVSMIVIMTSCVMPNRRWGFSYRFDWTILKRTDSTRIQDTVAYVLQCNHPAVLKSDTGFTTDGSMRVLIHGGYFDSQGGFLGTGIYLTATLSTGGSLFVDTSFSWDSLHFVEGYDDTINSKTDINEQTFYY